MHDRTSTSTQKSTQKSTRKSIRRSAGRGGRLTALLAAAVLTLAACGGAVELGQADVDTRLADGQAAAGGSVDCASGTGPSHRAAVLTTPRFEGAMACADFSAATLTQPAFVAATVDGATFTGAVLAQGSYENSSFRGADFTGATFAGGSFTDSDLTGAVLNAAVLTGVSFSNTICPDGTNSDINGGTCSANLAPAAVTGGDNTAAAASASTSGGEGLAACTGVYRGELTGPIGGPMVASLDRGGVLVVDVASSTANRMTTTVGADGSVSAAGEGGAVVGAFDWTTCTGSGQWELGGVEGSWTLGLEGTALIFTEADCDGGVYVGNGAVSIVGRGEAATIDVGNGAVVIDSDGGITVGGAGTGGVTIDEDGGIVVETEDGTGGVTIDSDGGIVVGGEDGTGGVTIDEDGGITVGGGEDGTGGITIDKDGGFIIGGIGLGPSIAVEGDEGSISIDEDGGVVIENEDGGRLTTPGDGSATIESGDGSAITSDGRGNVSIDADTSCISSSIVRGATVAYDEVPEDSVEVTETEDGYVAYGLSADVLFDFNSSEVSDASLAVLDQVIASVADRFPGRPITVIGHTDSIGSDAYNQGLSQARSNAVAAVLLGDGRLSASTIDASGLGETQPVAANVNPDGTDNPAGRADNRRVEIVVER